MAQPYSTRFIAFSASETPPGYTVPAGFVVVLRDLDLVSGGGSIINWQMQIAGGAKLAAGQFTVESLPQHQFWRGRQVLNAGETVFVSADGSLDGAVSGYLLNYG
jgi:hypothetical protein